MDKIKRHAKIYICKFCGAEFCLLERPRHHKLFCSKEHQIAYLKQHPSLPQKVSKYQTGEQFIEDAKKVILDKGRYVSMDEIGRVLHVCSQEFKRFSINIKELNAACGMVLHRSIGHTIVENFLKRYFVDVESEKSFKDLISPNGMVLRFDICVESQKLLVEIDGRIHASNHAWNTPYRELCSRMKTEYAAKHEYKLLRIPIENVRSFKEEDLFKIFKDFISNVGNQQPEATGMPSNGSETDSVSRTDAAAARKRNTAERDARLRKV